MKEKLIINETKMRRIFYLEIFDVMTIRARIASISLRSSFKLTCKESDRTRVVPTDDEAKRILFISNFIACISSNSCFKYCLVSSSGSRLLLLLLFLLLLVMAARYLGWVRDECEMVL